MMAGRMVLNCALSHKAEDMLNKQDAELAKRNKRAAKDELSCFPSGAAQFLRY